MSILQNVSWCRIGGCSQVVAGGGVEGGGGVVFLIFKVRTRVNLQASEESYAIN